MSNPIEVEALLDLVRFAGPGAASRLAEGRSIFTPEDQVDLVVGRSLVEALSSYVADVDHPFADTMSATHDLPDGIHNHSRSEEPDPGLGVARQLLAKASSLGVLIPRLQLAIRETQDYSERAGIVAVLDRALDAHRELSDWCARAGAYNTERAAAVVGEFDELVREIQGKAAAPFASADHMLAQDTELGEASTGCEDGHVWRTKGGGTVKACKRCGRTQERKGFEDRDTKPLKRKTKRIGEDD